MCACACACACVGASACACVTRAMSAPAPNRVLYVLLALTPQEQLELYRGLTSDGVWFALTCGSTLDKGLADRLRGLGSVVTVFRKQLPSRAAGGRGRFTRLSSERDGRCGVAATRLAPRSCERRLSGSWQAYCSRLTASRLSIR